MKSNKIYTLFTCMILVVFISSCKLDNYPGPDGGISGNLVDKNTHMKIPAGQGSNANFGQLQFYQQGYSSITPNPITLQSGFKIDGSYTDDHIFNGSYKIIPSGPYFYTDTAVVKVSGQTNFDIKVIPWIDVMIQTGAVTSTSITITFTAKRNIAAEAILPQLISQVTAVIGQTQTVEINDYLQKSANTTTASNDETGNTVFTATFSGLTPNTLYYLRACSTTGTSNPNNYFNYSPVIQVTTSK